MQNSLKNQTIEGEHYTEELVYRDNPLLNLVNDSVSFDKFFENIDISEFTNENLEKLKDEYTKATQIKKKKEQSPIRKLINKRYKPEILTKEESYVLVCKSKIDEFNKNLSYMLYLDIISFEEAKKRGFESGYLKQLLEEARKIVQDPYNHYFSYPGAEKRSDIANSRRSNIKMK